SIRGRSSAPKRHDRWWALGQRGTSGTHRAAIASPERQAPGSRQRGRRVAHRAAVKADEAHGAATAAGSAGAAVAARPSPGQRIAPDTHHGPSFLTRLRRDWVMLALVMPGLLYFLTFHYAPLFGYVTAFQDYRPFLGFVESPFVGAANFQAMVN